MPIEHSALTDTDGLHEPKGASTAAINTVYRATGGGSGAWKLLPGSQYADMYIDVGATAQALGAAGVYAKLDPGTEWHAGYNNGLTVDAVNGEITLATAGIYLIDFWVTFTTAAIAAGATYGFKYAIDGSTSTRVLSTQKNTAGADRIACSATGIVSATAGQKLSIHVAGLDATSATTNITVNDAGLTAVLLHAT